MKKLRKNKGITLIALVITIVVLLILAVIIINIVLGKNGLIQRTKTAGIYNRKSQAEEYLIVDIQRVIIDNQGNISLKKLLDDFKREEKTDIIVTEVVMGQVACLDESITQIPDGDPTEITVVIEKYEEFNFTIGDKCTITKICGIDADKWNGQTTSPLDINWDEIELIKPNIEIIRNKGIPMLTQNGIVGGNTATVRIDYGEGSYIKKLYSEDDGQSWKEYTGEINTSASTIKAKSVIKYKETIQSEIDTATISGGTSNLPDTVYDNDDTTGVTFGTNGDVEYYILISNDIIGDPVRIKKFSNNNVNYSDSIQFLDENKTVLFTGETKYGDSNDPYFIPNNTKWLRYTSRVHPSHVQTADTNKLYEIAINYQPIISGEISVYPVLKQTEVDASSNVTIYYYKTSVTKLYKKNTDQNWKEYHDNEIINLKLGETLYAKAYDSDNVETRTSQFSINLKDDAIGANAFDKNDSTNFRVVKAGTINRYMKISNDMKGNRVRIRQYLYNNQNWYSDIKFLRSDKSVSSTITRESGTTDKSYDIPMDAEWILFTAYGTNGSDESYRSRIFEIAPGN